MPIFLTAFLSKLGGKVTLALAAAVLLLVAFLYVQHLRGDLAAAQARDTTLTAANAQDVKAIAGYQAAVAAGEQAEVGLDRRVAALQAGVSHLHATIAEQAARPGQDGAVAPVLSATLDSLRGAK